MGLRPEDLFLAEQLIRLGYVTRAEIDPAGCGEADLGAGLIAAGHITPAQLDQERSALRAAAVPAGAAERDPAEPPPEVVQACERPHSRAGKFVLVERVGRGGSGEVWKAWDAEIGRYVALKLLLSPDESDADRKRLLREARVAARLAHPNIAPVYEVGDTPRGPFISMRHIAGPTLADSGLTHQALAAALRQAALAIDYAHREGVVHRDLKPQNLMVEFRDGEAHVWVMDFGMAKQRSVSTSLSASGVVVGTPAYMPPEQARGRSGEVDGASDVYALGATLYHMLAGRPPFVGEDAPQVLDRVVREDLVPPSKLVRGAPRSLEAIALKCLEKTKARRYPNAKELADDLQRYIEGRPVRARPAGTMRRLARAVSRRVRPAVIVPVAVALAVGAIAFLRPERPPPSAAVGLNVPPPEPPPFGPLLVTRAQGIAAFREGDPRPLSAAAGAARLIQSTSEIDAAKEEAGVLASMSAWLEQLREATAKPDPTARAELEGWALPPEVEDARRNHLALLDQAVARASQEERTHAVARAVQNFIEAGDWKLARSLLKDLALFDPSQARAMESELLRRERHQLEQEARERAVEVRARAEGRFARALAERDPARRKLLLEETLADLDAVMRHLTGGDVRFLQGRALHLLRRWAEAREAFGAMPASDAVMSRAHYWSAAGACLQAVEEESRGPRRVAELHQVAEAQLDASRRLGYAPKHWRLLKATVLSGPGRPRERAREGIQECTLASEDVAPLDEDELAAGLYLEWAEPEQAFRCDALLLRAVLHGAVGNHARRVEDARNVRDLAGKHLWEARLELARGYEALGRDDQAKVEALEVRDRSGHPGLADAAVQLLRQIDRKR